MFETLRHLTDKTASWEMSETMINTEALQR